MQNTIKTYKGKKALEIAKALRLKHYHAKKDKRPQEAKKHLKKYKEMEAKDNA